jgi:hypothetical protein
LDDQIKRLTGCLIDALRSGDRAGHAKRHAQNYPKTPHFRTLIRDQGPLSRTALLSAPERYACGGRSA